MEKLNNFHFRTWHFVSLLAILFISTNILGHIKIKNTPSYLEETCCVEISDNSFQEAVSSDLAFVFFYKENSDVCARMEYNLNMLAAKVDPGKIDCYKLDIEKYPGRYSNYDLSDIPNLIIYKNGKDMERIMGLVPISNLEIIYNRVVK